MVAASQVLLIEQMIDCIFLSATVFCLPFHGKIQYYY